MTLEGRRILDGHPPPPPEHQGPGQRARPRPAPLSWGLLALCVLNFFFEQSGKGQIPFSTSPDGEGPLVLLRWGTLYGPALQQGQWWRLLTYAIEHGGPLHLLFNASAIGSLGTALERMIGTWRFFLISVAGTLGCASFALFAHFDIALVGASGMILGWAAAMLPILTAQGRRQMAWMLVQVAAISLLPGVSLAGHLGGFLFGLPFGFALRLGPVLFSRVSPVLLFLSAVAAVVASHSPRLGL